MVESPSDMLPDRVDVDLFFALTRLLSVIAPGARVAAFNNVTFDPTQRCWAVAIHGQVTRVLLARPFHVYDPLMKDRLYPGT